MDGGDKRESPDSTAQSKSPRTLSETLSPFGTRRPPGRLRRKRRQTGGKRRKAVQPACARRRSRTEGEVPKSRSNNEGASRGGGRGGRPRIRENASPIPHATDTVRDTRVPRFGRRASSNFDATHPRYERAVCREIRSYGSVMGALGDQSPYRDCYFLEDYSPSVSEGALCDLNRISRSGN